jgi:hypothetical protein
MLEEDYFLVSVFPSRLDPGECFDDLLKPDQALDDSVVVTLVLSLFDAFNETD